MRLYLDTSVFGGYFDEEFSEPTRKLFEEIFAGKHSIFISNITLDELKTAPSSVQNLITKIPINRINKITINDEVESLSDNYLLSGIISKKYYADALHIALATLHRVDILVSWNFKHMVNINRIREYNSVNLLKGFPTIDIRTPREVSYEN